MANPRQSSGFEDSEDPRTASHRSPRAQLSRAYSVRPLSGPSRGSPARTTDTDLSAAPSNLSGVGEDRTKAARSRIKKMMKEFVMGEVSSDMANANSGNGSKTVDTL